MRYTNEIIANRDTKRNINTQKQASIFHQPAFIVMTTQGSSSLVRVTGLEPAWFPTRT